MSKPESWEQRYGREHRELSELFDDRFSSPQSWRGRREKEVSSLVGNMDMDKCEKFASYLNDVFIKAISRFGVVGLNKNWNEVPLEDKIFLTQSFINNVIDILMDDIVAGRVQVYKGNGEVYDGARNPGDEMFANFALQRPKINVKSAGTGMMAVQPTGDVLVNYDFPIYRSFRCFAMDLRHEMAHIVDVLMPQISPLSHDVVRNAVYFYLDQTENAELYANNPLERNANLKRDEFAKQYDAMLQQYEYMRKKDAPDIHM